MINKSGVITECLLCHIFYFSFVVLCMNCVLPSIMSVGYEIAVKIASVVRKFHVFQLVLCICTRMCVFTIQAYHEPQWWFIVGMTKK